MTRTWDETFRLWAQSPSSREQTRCENAVRVIRNAIDAHPKLGTERRAARLKVFVQGSYRNRVNVRAESDVDVGVLYTGSFFAQYPPGHDEATFRDSPATYTYQQFKNDLETALANYLGDGKVARGNKSIRIRETSYHVEADVAPFFEHRWYLDASRRKIPGVELRPDNSPRMRVINFPEALFPGWPKEHYENGRDKNDATRRRYRGLVRILKKLRIQMADAGIATAQAVPGYLLECLTWNAPNTRFGSHSWDERVQSVLAYLWSNARHESTCREWREVDDLKALFSSAQPWNREQAYGFLNDAWSYVGVRSS